MQIGLSTLPWQVVCADSCPCAPKVQTMQLHNTKEAVLTDVVFMAAPTPALISLQSKPV